MKQWSSAALWMRTTPCACGQQQMGNVRQHCKQSMGGIKKSKAWEVRPLATRGSCGSGVQARRFDPGPSSAFGGVAGQREERTAPLHLQA
jgi:hypothetical protein